jgi:hypothetical protein
MNTGELIEIIRHNFINDKLYYEKIMKFKNEFTKSQHKVTKFKKSS